MSPFKDDRSGDWCADFVDENGIRRRPSLAKQGVTTSAQAKIVEARMIARVDAIQKGIAVAERNPNNRDVKGAVEWYLALPKVAKSKNAKDLGYALRKHVVGDFASMRIENVKPGDVADWLDEREAAAELSDGTVNRLRAYLSGMFSRLIAREQLVGDNPVRKVERRDEDEGEARLLPVEAITVLLESAASSEWTLAFYIAAFTGMRRGEIRRLRWADVDHARGVINVVKTKARKNRVVPIHPELRPVLDEHKGARGALVVALTSWNRAAAVTRAALARGGFAIDEDLDACFHSIRHTFITACVDAGADPWAVAWVTHGPPESLGVMGKVYLRPTASLAREIAKLAWPSSTRGAERQAAALLERAKLLEAEVAELRTRAAALVAKPAEVVLFPSPAVAENGHKESVLDPVAEDIKSSGGAG